MTGGTWVSAEGQRFHSWHERGLGPANDPYTTIITNGFIRCTEKNVADLVPEQLRDRLYNH